MDTQNLNPNQDEFLWTVEDLINRLNLPHPNPTEQLRRRLDSLDLLQKMGSPANAAIPTLLPLHFNADPFELRQAALDTIRCINPNWLQDESLHSELIPFLLKQLSKDANQARKAEDFLVKIGTAAQRPLLRLIQPDSGADAFSRANAILTLSKSKPQIPELLPILQQLIPKASTEAELKACAEALGALEETSDEQIQALLELLRHNVSWVKEKALLALGKVQEGNLDLAILPLVELFTHEDTQIRNLAVDALARNKNSGALRDLLRFLLNHNGQASSHDMKKILEDLSFWLQHNRLESFRMEESQFRSNFSWQQIQLERSLQKPIYLLEAVLNLCKRIQFADSSIYTDLLNILQKYEQLNIRLACVGILAMIPAKRAQTIPVLVELLNTDSKVLRDALLQTLNALDPQWFKAPAMEAYLQNFLQDINGLQEKNQAIELLSALGPESGSLLVTHLEQAKDRLAQEAIVEVLNAMNTDLKGAMVALERIKGKLSNRVVIEGVEKLMRRWG